MAAGPSAGNDNAQGRPPRRGGLYTDSTDALKAVREDYLYWTGKLTDSSFELSLAIVAANWAAFGSVDKILTNFWAKTSLGLLIVSLAISLYGARWMGELHCKRVKYASDDADRWDRECAAALHARGDSWPFTKAIERLGKCLRAVTTWCPLLAGVLFLVALFTAQ